MTDLALLTACGQALFGEQWQRALARALGPLHPSGAREAIDDRGVRRIVAGERPVPAWYWPALASLLRQRRARADKEKAEAGRLVAVIAQRERQTTPTSA